MSQIQAMKKTVLQLRQEANIQRITVSQACEDLMKYCTEHQKNDVLVTGMSQSDNPYRDIKGCTII